MIPSSQQVAPLLISGPSHGSTVQAVPPSVSVTAIFSSCGLLDELHSEATFHSGHGSARGGSPQQ